MQGLFMSPSFPLQIQVQHPAAKSMIEISRTQDEEVGDGTTSVIILGKITLCMLLYACLHKRNRKSEKHVGALNGHK